MTTPQARRSGSFPTRAFLVAISLVCVGLVVSAVHGFLTLARLRDEVLRNRGHEIASRIDAQTRGPGRRNNLDVWQAVLEENWQLYRNSIAFVVLLDHAGRPLATAGESRADAPDAPSAEVNFQGSTLFLFEEDLPAPPPLRRSHAPEAVGWRLRIGLYTSPADAIRRQAHVHLVVAAVAIITLLGLAFYFLRTLRRFLELKAREESERHLAMLGRMATTLAHEIRNPLGAMKGLTQVVQEELPKDHNAQALMQTVVSEAERLEQLVIDLLTFARPRDSVINRFNVRELIADVSAMLQAKLVDAAVTVKVVTGADSLLVQSDENGLRQVLLNVLLNAIEASPPGGVVTVAARRDAGGQQVVIDIDDNGAGLGDRDPEEFFQPFMTTKVKGTGLGLPISRQIVERVGGKMTLANRPEGSARCTIRLPVKL
jgi:signal transduction histidine kinase